MPTTAKSPESPRKKKAKPKHKAAPTKSPLDHSELDQAIPTSGGAATFRDEFGLSRKTLSRMTGLSERTLATWEGGGKINETGQRTLISIDRFLRQLSEVIRVEAIAAWLETPSEGFRGLKPIEVIERGEIDRLWRMIYFLGSGTPS